MSIYVWCCSDYDWMCTEVLKLKDHQKEKLGAAIAALLVIVIILAIKFSAWGVLKPFLDELVGLD